MQPQVQIMAITSVSMAIVACRTPPKATIMIASTPRKERTVASDIDDSLERISSNSMIGSPVKPELRARMPRLHLGGQLPQDRDRFAVLGEVLVVLFGEFQQHQAHAAVVGHRRLAANSASSGLLSEIIGPGRLVRAGLSERRFEPFHHPRQFGLHGRKDLAALRLGAAGHGRAHPVRHAAQAQRRPVALENGAGLVQKTVDLPKSPPA